MGIEYTVDPGIVRGLDYYTKTAFEFVTTTVSELRVPCAAAADTTTSLRRSAALQHPGVGFGLGKETTAAARWRHAEHEIPEPDGTDVFIAFMGDDAKGCRSQDC